MNLDEHADMMHRASVTETERAAWEAVEERDTSMNQLSFELVSHLLHEENGVSEDTWNLCRELLSAIAENTQQPGVLKDVVSVFHHVDATDGRFYLSEPKEGVLE